MAKASPAPHRTLEGLCYLVPHLIQIALETDMHWIGLIRQGDNNAVIATGQFRSTFRCRRLRPRAAFITKSRKPARLSYHYSLFAHRR